MNKLRVCASPNPNGETSVYAIYYRGYYGTAGVGNRAGPTMITYRASTV